MIKILSLLLLLGLISACGKMNNDQKNITTGDSGVRFYGEKIKYKQKEPIRFSNFVLTYAGERRVVSDLSNGAKPPSREFVFHDFKARSGNDVQTVSWSSGTGDIGPTPFAIGGKKYELELALSDRLGRLAEDELVVWEK